MRLRRLYFFNSKKENNQKISSIQRNVFLVVQKSTNLFGYKKFFLNQGTFFWCILRIPNQTLTTGAVLCSYCQLQARYWQSVRALYQCPYWMIMLYQYWLSTACQYHLTSTGRVLPPVLAEYYLTSTGAILNFAIANTAPVVASQQRITRTGTVLNFS